MAKATKKRVPKAAHGRYILKGHKPVLCKDLLTWAAWLETADRRVAQMKVGKVAVSTVFLGLDHGWGGRVLLFETLVFGGKYDQEQVRYSTWNAAAAGHLDMCRKVFGSKVTGLVKEK